MVQQTCEGHYEFREPTLRREPTVRSEDLSGEGQGESGVSQPAEPTDDAEARADFWSVQADFYHRHHNELRVQLHGPKEETFPILLKYMDVTRSIHTDLDVTREERFDDFWIVDSNRHLSDSWRGFTKLTIGTEKPPKGFMWSGRRLTKSQTTTRPDHGWPEVWTKIGKAAQNREQQEWAEERPKLDNARRLRRIYFIDPDEREYSEIPKHARRKLQRPMAPAMPCAKSPEGRTKVCPKSETASEKTPKTLGECIVESFKSTRQRVESFEPKNHEDHIAGKGFTSMSHDKFGAQVHPDTTSNENSGCQSCRQQRVERARDNSSMEFG